MSLCILEELVLEYLSTQYEPVEYSKTLLHILEDDSLSNIEIKVDLWFRLYHNRNILVLVYNEYNKFNEYFSLSNKKKRLSSINNSTNSLLSNEFESYIDKSKLLCSNSFRIKRMNLVLYGNVVKSYERFQILMRIASKRYNGCWQSDLTLDLGIPPKTLFPYLNTLCKLGLIYKLTIPHNRISKYLLSNSESIRYDLDKDDPLSRVQSVASICFYSKYFVIEKLPSDIKMLCFNDITKLAEDKLISLLEGEENNILLESDWKSIYFDVALNEINLLNTRIENYVISRSYLSLRKSLEIKNKIRRAFAWCPQTNKFERCIILYKHEMDINKDRFDKKLHVINLNIKNDPTKITVEKVKNKIISPLILNGHSINEFIYYIILSTYMDGITAKDIYKIFPIGYKQLSKIILSIESMKLIRKETFRCGKMFMYKYYPVVNNIKDVQSIGREYNSISDDEDEDEEDYKVLDKIKSFEDEPNSILSYEDYVKKQHEVYNDDTCYIIHFNYLFPSLKLPKQVDTLIFKRRMVLLYKYINYFKAATLSNISYFYTDVEKSSTKMDRKTVLRVSKYLLDEMAWVKVLRTEELKGSKSSLTILYDSRVYNEMDAYSVIKRDISCRRNLSSIHTATLQHKINESFKNPDDINGRHVTSNTLPGSDLRELEGEVNRGGATPSGTTSVGTLTGAESRIGPQVESGRGISDGVYNIGVAVPCIISNISVNQMNINVNRYHLTTSRSLYSNGFIYPVVTRVKHLHLYLIDNYIGRRFKSSEVVNNMTLELYFQVIGCNYDLVVDDYKINPLDRVGGLPKNVLSILTTGKRDPVSVLNHLFNILLRLNLLKMYEEYGNGLSCSIDWELNIEVELYELNDLNRLVDIYNMNKPLEYWDKLKELVDEYMEMIEEMDEEDDYKLPRILPIKELYVKKNWKPLSYLNTSIKCELDLLIQQWLNIVYDNINSKLLLKIIYIPPYMLSYCYERFNIPHYQIYGIITNKIKNMKSIPGHFQDEFGIYNIIKDVNRDFEYMWISKLVIAEKLANCQFYHTLTKGRIETTPTIIPESDLRELEGEVNKKATTASGRPSSSTITNRRRGSPPDVRPAVSSSNYLSLKSIATPGDRGDIEYMTSSGLPESDLREAEGEVNERGTTAVGREIGDEGRDRTSSGEDGAMGHYRDKNLTKIINPMKYLLFMMMSTRPRVDYP